eukprot:11385705-Prorocentrum_lima.AAC.1
MQRREKEQAEEAKKEGTVDEDDMDDGDEMADMLRKDPTHVDAASVELRLQQMERLMVRLQQEIKEHAK